MKSSWNCIRHSLLVADLEGYQKTLFVFQKTKSLLGQETMAPLLFYFREPPWESHSAGNMVGAAIKYSKAELFLHSLIIVNMLYITLHSKGTFFVFVPPPPANYQLKIINNTKVIFSHLRLSNQILFSPVCASVIAAVSKQHYRYNKNCLKCNVT